MGFQMLDGEKGSITDAGEHTVEIYTEVIIDAPPEKVWAVLTDFDRLGEWSNNFVGLDGNFEKEARVVVTFKTGIGNHTTTYDHTLWYFEDGRLFGWSDPIGMGLTDNHKYIVEPADGGKTKFIQTDALKGAIEALIGHHMARASMQSYVLFNRLLKERVEADA